MKIIRILVVITISILLCSCGAQTVSFIFAPFTKISEHKINYVTEQNDFLLNESCSINVKIFTSSNWESKETPGIPIKIDSYYSKPYYFQIFYKFNDNSISKIVFKKCILAKADQTIDLLQSKELFISPSIFDRDTGTSYSTTSDTGEKEVFIKTKSIIISIDNSKYANLYNVGFENINIDPVKDSSINIEFEFDIIFKDGKVQKIKRIMKFDREYRINGNLTTAST